MILPVLATLLSLLAPVCLLAQPTPTGSEFQANTYTTNAQSRPAVATWVDGSFVLVWESFGQDGSDFGVFGQRFASDGGFLATGYVFADGFESGDLAAWSK